MVATGALLSLTMILGAVLSVAFHILLALAINSDCRARNLKATTLLTVLALFFPVVTGVVYACVRDTAEPNEKYCAACNIRVDGGAKFCPNCHGYVFKVAQKPDAAALAKRGVALCIAAAIVFVCGCGSAAARTALAGSQSNSGLGKWLEQFTEEKAQNTDDSEETTTAAASDSEEDTTSFDDVLSGLKYYDRNGKAYDSAEKVPFYDRDGNVYLCAKDENYITYFYREGTEEKLDMKQCFVDKDGYFIYDDKGNITLSADGFSAEDKDGTAYSPAALVIWNKDGTMISALN